MHPDRTGTRLSLALLGYFVVVTLVITLVPFRFEMPDRLHVMLSGTVLDTSANVLLFLPLGFLFRLARPAGAWLGALLCDGAVKRVGPGAELVGRLSR